MFYLPTVLLTLVLFEAKAAYTLEDIPKPQPPNSYVSNPDGIIDASTEAYVNRRLQLLEDTTTSQVAVVVVQSIGEEVPRDFGIELFRLWGVGQEDNDNGLLILMVIDQRRVEFITGYGLEGVLPDILCVRLQELYMIPPAKEGNYSKSVADGVDAVIHVLTDSAYRQEIYSDAQSNTNMSVWRQPAEPALLIIVGALYMLFAFGGFRSRKKSLEKAPDYIKHQYSDGYVQSKFMALNILLPLGLYGWQEVTGHLRTGEFILGFYGLLAALLLEKRIRLNTYIRRENEQQEPQETYMAMRRSHSKGWLAATIFFPLPFLLYDIFNRLRIRKFRYAAPLSADGVTPMTLMDEKTDDTFLESYQLVEEKIKSIDYDVWQNPITQEKKIFRFENFFSKYKPCPSCSSKAYCMTKNKTLVSATYTSTGVGEKTFSCKACQYQKQEQYTIAKLTRSSSSSGGGGFSGGGGGGFGGGSTGGGGGGSSW